MGKDNLDVLKKLEEQHKQQNTGSTIDGYLPIPNDELPQGGKLYPENWKFANRAPLSKEVANFSVINDGDNPAIVSAIEDLINKCVVIYDTDSQEQISSGKILDFHRMFFMLKLRDSYLKNNPPVYETVCTDCQQPFTIKLTADKLIFKEISEDLLEAFDGRRFKLDMEDGDVIEFLAPTIELTSRLFKYVVKVFKDSQRNPDKKIDKVVYDKQFLLIAPYLYVLGNETIKELSDKYTEIKKQDALYQKYIKIATLLDLGNLEYIDEKCPNCGSLEEAQVKFPGGWKRFFITTGNTTKKYFE